jgi:diguanylate cyclase (GGDEF)-like protein/PAS domain S-box-containing protein
MLPSANTRRRLRALLPRSIVARTTVSIIALAMIVGLVFAGFAAVYIQHSEKTRLEARLDELLLTVESTLSIACFVKDAALAREIGTGLMRNDGVAGVRILADDTPLYEELRPDAVTDGGTMRTSRPIRSPFDANQIVGSVSLDASSAVIQARAWTYTRFMLLILALEVGLVAISVAWIVFNLITQPIKGISDELHRLEVRTGVRLHVPHGNQEDEIGRLVSDVNALIGELTGLVETERTLRLEREQSERKMALIFEKVDTGIFEVDAGGRLHSWNPAFMRTLGEPGEPPLLQDLLPTQGQPVQALIRGCLSNREACEADIELAASPDQPARWIEMSLTPVDPSMLQGVINDITERKHAEMAAQQMATRDTVTGLLNRRGLDRGLEAIFARRREDPGLAVALMLIDLDFFKQVNDTHGHEAGDTVLRAVAATLEGAVRRSDLVGRFGGDEFAVALVGLDEQAKAQAIGETLIAELKRPINLDNGAQAQIGGSIGIAFVEGEDDTPAALMRRADDAMYAAKQAGRGRLHLARPRAGGSATPPQPAS